MLVLFNIGRRPITYNGLQAGTVCSLKQCLPNVCLKILMFVAFAKMKNLSAENFAKAITSSAQIGLAWC